MALPIQPQKVLHLDLELEKKTPKLFGDYLITTKKDGWYVEIWYNPKYASWDKIVSSAGRAIPAFQWLIDEHVLDNGLPTGMSYACKLIVEADMDDLPFHIKNGHFNRSKGECACREVRFWIHDLLTEANLVNHNLARFFETEQFLELVESKQRKHGFPSLFRKIPYHGFSSLETVWRNQAERVWNEGEEGIVLKACSQLYYPGKRNSTLMKLKLETTFDLLVNRIFWTKGEKDNEALNVELRRKTGQLITVVVPKFSDIDTLTKLPEEILKRTVCTIKCMKELEGGMLREPRFYCIRNDKLPEEID